MKNIIQILLIVVSFNVLAQNDTSVFIYTNTGQVVKRIYPEPSDKDIAAKQLRAYTKECLQDSIVVAYEIRYGIEHRLFSDETDTVYVDSANKETLKDFTHFIIKEIIIPKEVTLEGFEEYLNRNRYKEILNKLK